jgi:hypothetical protein
MQKLVQATQLKEEGWYKWLLQAVAYGIVKGVKNEALIFRNRNAKNC